MIKAQTVRKIVFLVNVSFALSYCFLHGRWLQLYSFQQRREWKMQDEIDIWHGDIHCGKCMLANKRAGT